MYVRVYAPNGEPFDVTRHRADELILQSGWTQSPPVVAPIETAPEEGPTPSADADAVEEQPTRRRKKAAKPVEEDTVSGLNE